MMCGCGYTNDRQKAPLKLQMFIRVECNLGKGQTGEKLRHP